MDYKELMQDMRFEYEITQKEMAKILGISRSTYNAYEQQYIVIPLKYVIAFCDYFHISIDYFFSFTKENNYIYSEINLKKIGIKLRKIRQKKHLKQMEFADILKITNAALSSYERGHILINTTTLYSICKLYNISADFILNRSDKVKIENNKVKN